jgi:hypothetical protein
VSADSLIACGGLDQRDLMQRFVRWWRNGENSPTGYCVDIGITTREALSVPADRQSYSAIEIMLAKFVPGAISSYTPMHDGGRIVSAVTIIAVTVATEGRREIVGLGIGPSDTEPFWPGSIKS